MPKIAEPATNVSAPARAAAAMLSGLMPPSISSRIDRPLPAMISRASLKFVEARRDELLSAEAWIHRHDQHQVHHVEHVRQMVERCRRIEYEPCSRAAFADQSERAVQVFGRLRVNADVVGAGVQEIANQTIDRLHHQVHVDRHLQTVLAQRRQHQRADRRFGT